jgi:pimeloyl-ACP methyl ester carboxylesterase
VLLHGLGMSWRAWEPVLATLQEQHDVLAPTLPGHRGGPARTAAPTISALADEVEAEMDRAGITEAHLVGNSLGGWLALELARRGRGRSVIAFSPAGAWRSRKDLVRLQVGLRVSRRLLANPLLPAYTWQSHTRRMALLGLMQRADRMTPAQAIGVIRDIRACTLLEEAVRMGAREGQIPMFNADRCPLRIVWGTHDRVIPHAAYGRPFIDRFPTAEHIALSGAGHVPMYDAPSEVTQLILEVTTRVGR